MFGSELLDVAIGIVFLYVLMATLCTAVVELVSTLTKMRSKQLAIAMVNILADPKLEEALAQKAGKTTDEFKNWLQTRFNAHPLIKSLCIDGASSDNSNRKPSYIPSRTFSAALLDIAREAAKECPNPQSFTPSQLADPVLAEIENTLAKLPPDSSLRRLLTSLLTTSQTNATQFTGNLEKWFDDVMDRVGGLYKRCAQYTIFAIAAVLVAALNVDTLAICDQLANNKTFRDAVVAAASKYVVENPDMSTSSFNTGSIPAPDPKPPIVDVTVYQDQIKKATKDISAAGFEIGWKNREWCKLDNAGRLKKVFGLLLTTFAVSLGAPFWFDLLNKLVNLRGSGPKPTVSPDKPATPKPGA